MTPSEIIQEFLNQIECWKTEYNMAFENVGREDKRLQDLVHELEFSQNARERNRVASKLHKSRKIRRKNKDTVLLLENVVSFFEEPQNKKVLNQLVQLLGTQRKQEKMILSERSYRPRVEETTVNSLEGPILQVQLSRK